MKRYFLIAFIIISLLVSCSTTQVKKSEPTAGPPVAETPATAQETAPEAEEAQEPEVTAEEAPEAEVPAEEEAVPEEQPVEEKEVTAELQPAVEESPNAQGEEESAIDEQDWSQVIGAAPSAEAEQETAAEEKKAEVAAAMPAREAPKAEKPQSAAKASNPSFVDRLTSVIKKTGNFIADEILLSIGIFLCVGGFVYLIAALAISSRQERQKRATHVKKAANDNTPFKPGKDEEPESDDDFLKSLLGDDSN